MLARAPQANASAVRGRRLFVISFPRSASQKRCSCSNRATTHARWQLTNQFCVCTSEGLKRTNARRKRRRPRRRFSSSTPTLPVAMSRQQLASMPVNLAQTRKPAWQHIHYAQEETAGLATYSGSASSYSSIGERQPIAGRG